MDTSKNQLPDTPPYAKPLWTILGCAIAAALLYTLIAQWPHSFNTTFTAQFPPPNPLPAPVAKTQAKKLTVGVILPLSGEKKPIGDALLRAAEMAVADINADPDAPALSLTTEDGGCDEKTAREAAKKLLTQNIHFLIGGACSEEVRGITTVIRGSAAILLSPSASEDGLRSDNIFRLVPSARQTAAAAKIFHTQDTEPNTEKRTLVPYFDEHTAAAERFFGRYKSHYQKDPITPWYLANMYSAFFLARDCVARFDNDVPPCTKWLATLTRWSGGALSDLSLTTQGDAAWETFVVQEKDWQGITRDISLFEMGK
jgi:ABC-type branched-subunit amino acid transport system substrate-binding protein